MLGVGLPEFILIAIVALIVIGPERMPEMAKAVAKAYVQLRKAGDELTKTIREVEPGPLFNERKSYAAKGAPVPAEPAPEPSVPKALKTNVAHKQGESEDETSKRTA